MNQDIVEHEPSPRSSVEPAECSFVITKKLRPTQPSRNSFYRTPAYVFSHQNQAMSPKPQGGQTIKHQHQTLLISRCEIATQQQRPKTTEKIRRNAQTVMHTRRRRRPCEPTSVNELIQTSKQKTNSLCLNVVPRLTMQRGTQSPKSQIRRT